MSSSSFVRSLGSLSRKLHIEAPARAFYGSMQPMLRRLQPHVSETSKCRARLSPYCAGYGIDAGFGGDLIVPHAIGVDLPRPYTDVGKAPVHLGGDATKLVWFADNSLDFVFSSHLLEDFLDTGIVLKEWLRVLKPGGRLIIFCPDEQLYRKHCASTGQTYNKCHVHSDFSLEFAKRALADTRAAHRVIHEVAVIDIYSWELVIEKIA